MSAQEEVQMEQAPGQEPEEEPLGLKGDELPDEDEEEDEADEQAGLLKEDSGEEAGFSVSAFPKVEITKELYSALKDQFERFDYDCSGLIDSEAEMNMIATNVAYMAFSEFHNKVGVNEVDKFVEKMMPTVIQSARPAS